MQKKCCPSSLYVTECNYLCTWSFWLINNTVMKDIMRKKSSAKYYWLSHCKIASLLKNLNLWTADPYWLLMLISFLKNWIDSYNRNQCFILKVFTLYLSNKVLTIIHSFMLMMFYLIRQKVTYKHLYINVIMWL